MADYLEQALQFIFDLLLWIPKKVWGLLLDGFATVIEAIPVPDFVANISGYFGAISPNIIFFAKLLAIPEGIAMYTTAMLLRFVIRRLPVIG